LAATQNFPEEQISKERDLGAGLELESTSDDHLVASADSIVSGEVGVDFEPLLPPVESGLAMRSKLSDAARRDHAPEHAGDPQAAEVLAVTGWQSCREHYGNAAGVRLAFTKL